MLNYISAKHAQLLQKNQLDTFEKVWNYKGDWFEEPNQRRGGWSGVNFLKLNDADGNMQASYLKRQLGFTRRTLLHPFAGEPTFVREYKVIQYLKSSGVTTPQIMFFSENNEKAILVTEELSGYMSWDVWIKENSEVSYARKSAVIAGIANTIKKLHQAGVQHRALYPKHLFVKDNNKQEVSIAVIDFEKSRITPLINWSRLSDLITLNYRTPMLTRTQRLSFFKHYLGVSKLSKWQKIICCYIHRQSIKKSQIK